MLTVSNIERIDWLTYDLDQPKKISSNSVFYARRFRTELGAASDKLEWGLMTLASDTRSIVTAQWSDGVTQFNLRFHVNGECVFTISNSDNTGTHGSSCYLDQQGYNWLELQTIVDSINTLTSSLTTVRTKQGTRH